MNNPLESTRDNFSTKDKDNKRLMLDSIYSPQSFTFDRIYNTSYNSQVIYKDICRDITKSAISGYNGNIMNLKY